MALYNLYKYDCLFGCLDHLVDGTHDGRLEVHDGREATRQHAWDLPLEDVDVWV